MKFIYDPFNLYKPMHYKESNSTHWLTSDLLNIIKQNSERSHSSSYELKKESHKRK